MGDDDPVTSTGTRTLLVMRHAKAEPYAEEDRYRRLTDRGRDDARDAGRHLADRGLVPDHALVSSALRAQETWAAVREGAGCPVEAELLEELYAATPGSALEWLQVVPDDRRALLMVGHNPTAGELVHLLDDGEGDPALLGGMLQGFPPAAVAVFELPGAWAELREGGARLTHFYVGHS